MTTGKSDSIQELRREFTKWSTVSYAVSILGVLGSVYLPTDPASVYGPAPPRPAYLRVAQFQRIGTAHGDHDDGAVRYHYLASNLSTERARAQHASNRPVVVAGRFANGTARSPRWALIR